MERLAIRLNTPYAEKDIVKNEGAKWDATSKNWYFDVVPEQVEEILRKFGKYVSEVERLNVSSKVAYILQFRANGEHNDRLRNSNTIVKVEILESKIIYTTNTRVVTVSEYNVQDKTKYFHSQTYITNQYESLKKVKSGDVIDSFGKNSIGIAKTGGAITTFNKLKVEVTNA